MGDRKQLLVPLVGGQLTLDVVDVLEELAEFLGEPCAEVLGLAGLEPLGKPGQGRTGDAQCGLSGVEPRAVLYSRRFSRRTAYPSVDSTDG